MTRKGSIAEALEQRAKHRMKTYTLERLRAMPTIRSGPVNDLKIDTGTVRVWLRRRPEGDAPNITVMLLEHDLWEKVGAFSKELSVPCQRLVER